jgi:hypothetical protein
VQGGGLGSPVDHLDANQDVLGTGFGVLHQHIKVAVVVKNARIQQLVLPLGVAPPLIFLHQVGIGIFGLGIFVEKL